MVALQLSVSLDLSAFTLIYGESTLHSIEHESPSLGHMCDVEDDDVRGARS